MEHPKTRKEAKARGAKHYFTGEPCSRGHVALRRVKGSCVECDKEDTLNNAAKRAEYFAAYNKRDGVKEKKHEWYSNNRDRVIAAASARPEHIKRLYRKNWKLRNKLQTRADTKARRRKHRIATPAWLTKRQRSEIRQTYQIAITMTQTTGEQYVVDHIVPLRSEVVSGLHVPWNLRIITRKENLLKSNTPPSDDEALAFPNP